MESTPLQCLAVRRPDTAGRMRSVKNNIDSLHIAIDSLKTHQLRPSEVSSDSIYLCISSLLLSSYRGEN